jgi:trans-aconitate 2-methyltransferase
MSDTPAPGSAQWNPAQYLRFADERLRPARDLLGRLPPRAYARIADLGCGAGNVTRLLAQAFPDAALVGVDSSAEMLASARRELPGARFVQADIASWQPDAPLDLVFTNATLQWLPDHPRLFPSLIGMLAPGGVLAAQFPDMDHHPLRRLIAEVAAEQPWREKLLRMPGLEKILSPAAYYDLLAPLVASLDLWVSEYMHVLEGENPVLEWVKGAALRPALTALEGAEREAFVATYGARLKSHVRPQGDGRTLLFFRRMFIVAEVGG